MKVILLKDVQNLGRVGEIKDVANGYAKNFLVPGGFAKIATEASVAQAEELRARKEKQAEKELKIVQQLAEKLSGVSVNIKTKTDEKGKLYAAVKADEISKALKEKGFDVDAKKIILPEPIKETGDYEAVIDFDHGLEIRIGVVVEKE